MHRSVLLAEVVSALAPRPGGRYADATLGLGGHAEAILEASAPSGILVGFDRDPEALVQARARLAHFGDRVQFVEASYSTLAARPEEFGPLDGLVADLGVSSLQLDQAERGFSFARSGPLDMRMGPGVGETLGEVLARIDEEELTEVLREYGEVSHPRRVARAILERRAAGQLLTTTDLADVVAKILYRPQKGGKKPIHPATLVFQGLRIYVNRELEELDRLLAALPVLLAPGGRAAIISFHSLEDRRVKRAFRGPEPEIVRRGLPVAVPESPFEVITRRPIAPSETEVADNPRARSAKLRVAERR